MPAVSNRKASDLRIASSSSTTWMMIDSSGIGRVLLRGRAEREVENTAPAGIWLNPKLAAMRLNNGARNGQADTHAGPLGRREGLKELRGNLRGDPGPGVGDGGLHHLAIRYRACECNLAAR